ncbi:Cytochrome-c oxidase [Deinococcus proteolyticus MRP]|uniref:Cytochrome-c oxidase n=1 Tax=Deinococcus proteolyticus (strain ATCC 35074 / DSM 20540 / JCM 6276 / NBRC 101906 / NCIMB 13154 / VKM Ac-1939 / CCM 2703 / MRP) TaxID=693977 RepID=F0RP62_DEIPM|nr:MULTISPECIES: cbb3-type cytochrome c oxidase subunit I [Deinococcus]ADY25377.1 Cytochrome-c oxidase [Deinococcus proteolyticus MRP]MCY1701502.1 cbb3-type cytochrome c oxidase subunit I [Deinococcus sp. SL84]
MTTTLPPHAVNADRPAGHGAPARTMPAVQDKAYLASLKGVTAAYVITAFVALLIGVLIGPLQALNYAGINVYDNHLLKLLVKSYYQGLTLHGVLNALVFTQFFISGWMLYLPVRDLGMRINTKFAWGTYAVMTTGLVLTAAALLLNDATVLYTLYPPMQGSPLFYIGASIFVAASWGVLGQVVYTWLQWKRQNPGKVTPLVTHMSVATWLMWFIASLGLVTEALVMLVPWSLGITKTIDPLIARTLFWWTGHAIVYFWLLPAYIAWYAFLPRHAGGRVASEPLVRLAFVLFLLNGVGVGLHHQFSNPNINNTWKIIHMLLTFLVVVPSLLTAFSTAAALEDGARANGGGGFVGWIRHLPWQNPVFVGITLSMISFIPGGAGGVVNASQAFAPVVHNTAWIPGHFHITVGTAVTMTFMAVSFWLIPHLLGKPLPNPKLARWSQWIWFWGMILFAVGMHWQGILGVPRRAQISAVAQPEVYEAMHLALPRFLTGLSGILLLIGGLMFFYVFFKMVFSRRVQDGEEIEIPYSPSISAAGEDLATASPLVRLTEPLLALGALGLIIVLMVYLPVLLPMVTNMQGAPGQMLWRN